MIFLLSCALKIISNVVFSVDKDNAEHLPSADRMYYFVVKQKDISIVLCAESKVTTIAKSGLRLSARLAMESHIIFPDQRSVSRR